MAIEAQTREIQGVKFRVQPLPFKPARKVLVRLANVAGPALAHLASQTASLGDLGLARAVSSALAAVSDDDLEWLADLYGERTQVGLDGKAPGPFLDAERRDELFSDPARFPLFFAWLGFCLEIQFVGFSGVLGSVKAASAPKHGTPDASEQSQRT
jgi:hypothetical protein